MITPENQLDSRDLSSSTTAFATKDTTMTCTVPVTDTPAAITEAPITSAPLTRPSKHYVHCQERYLVVEEMLEFAAEQGKLEPPSLAMEVKTLKKLACYAPEETITADQWCQTEAALEILYNKIAPLIAPVTIQTLRATSEKYAIRRPWWSAWLLGSCSIGRNFLRQLAWMGTMLMMMWFLGKYLQITLLAEDSAMMDFTKFFGPFLQGAIGSWIYLYKSLTDFYSTRQLNPQEAPNYWLRLLMGALAGGIVVHMFMPESSTEGAEATSIAPNIAVAFLAGYSVDFLYGILDRMVHSLLPPKGKEGEDQPLLPAAKQRQLEELQTQMEMLLMQSNATLTETIDKIRSSTTLEEKS